MGKGSARDLRFFGIVENAYLGNKVSYFEKGTIKLKWINSSLFGMH